MNLSELRLSDFAHFTNRTFSLQPGVNLVVGSNRAGKTVFFKALRSVASSHLAHGITAGTDSSPPAVAVRVDLAGQSQLLERVFDQNNTGALNSLAGVPLPLWLHAGFWSEGGLLALPEGEFGRTLRSLSLSGGQEDASVLPVLQDEYRRLTARDPWGEERESPGELEQVRERLLEIETHWEERLAVLKHLGSLRSEDATDGQNTATLPGVESPVVEADAAEHFAEPQEAAAQPDGLAAEATISFGDDDYPDDVCAEQSDRDPRKVRERLWAVQKEAAALRQELVAVPSLSILLPSVLTFLFLILGSALVLFHRDLWQAVAMAGGALILCTWAVFTFLSRNKGSELGRLRDQLGQVEAEREELLQELDRLDEQRRYGADEEQDEPPAEREPQVKTEASEATPAVPDPQQESLVVTTPKLSIWQQRRRLLTEVSDLRALEMEGETLRFREQQIVTRLKILATAIEMLLQAEDSHNGERRSELAGAVNRHLQQLLPQHTPQVAFSSSWQLELTREEGAVAVSPHELSRGEKTLLSLALHMALLEIGSGTPLPLVIDDLLDDLHHEWRENTLKVLRRFSERHQLVLTSRDQEIHSKGLAMGAHVIALDESLPTVKKAKAKPPLEGSDDEQQLHLL